MILNPGMVLTPVFDALDSLISNYGVHLYLVFVWLFLAVIVGILSCGLRRKRSQSNSAMDIPGIIFTMRPPKKSPPPIIFTDIDPVQNDGNERMDEP